MRHQGRSATARGPLLVLAVATLLAYGNSFTGERVHDDARYVAFERPLDGRTLVALFGEHATASAGEALPFYRPLHTASVALDARLYGPDPRGYHATSVACHVLAVLLLYLWLVRALRPPDQTREAAAAARWPVLLAALWFAVHPVHTEAVDSIYNRSQLLAGLFALAAMLALWRWAHARPRLAWGVAAGCYLLALLSKESAAPLPLVLAGLLLLLPPEGKPLPRRQLWGLATLLIPLAIYLVLRRAALAAAGASIQRALSDAPATLQGALALMAATVRDGLQLMIVPHPLRASYGDYHAAGLITAVLVTLAVIGAATALRKRAPAGTAGLALFVVTLLLPLARLFMDRKMSNLFAERHLYLPAIGLSLALARGLLAGQARLGTTPLVGLGVLVCVVLTGTTRARNREWRSNETLWLAEVAARPQNGEAWMQLTTHYLRKDQPDRVAELCRDHLEGHKHPQFFNNCAVASQRLGRYPEAEQRFARAIALGGGVVARANRARMLARIGRIADAEAEYQRAVDEESDPAMKHVRQGELLLRLHPDRVDEARRAFEAALRIDPKLPVALSWLAQLPPAKP
jgi:protein O-mannosyl-transferase